MYVLLQYHNNFPQLKLYNDYFAFALQIWQPFIFYTTFSLNLFLKNQFDFYNPKECCRLRLIKTPVWSETNSKNADLAGKQLLHL